jgi:hypothetical protein
LINSKPLATLTSAAIRGSQDTAPASHARAVAVVMPELVAA